jgi:hypothetical protein
VGRADRIMVINAPNFRNVAYLVYPLVPKEVKAKIEICGRRYQERLRELLVPVNSNAFHMFVCFLSLLDGLCVMQDIRYLWTSI